MPCAVPTCGSSDGTFKLFPRYGLLSERWLQAIQVGTGLQVAVAEAQELCQYEICEQHFAVVQHEQSDEYWYQEPTLFTHCNGELSEVASCRLCLNFHPSSNMIALSSVLDKEIVTSFLYKSLNIAFKDDDFLQMVCGECIVRSEILQSIWTSFLAAEQNFINIVATAQTCAREIHSKITLEHPPIDSFIEEVEIDTLPELSTVGEVDDKASHPEEPLPDPSHEETETIDRKATSTRFKQPTKRNEKKALLRAVIGRKCYICVTVFEDANELLSHLTEVISYNRHLGRHEAKERPNKCSICQLGFSSCNQVKVHEKKMHGIKNNAKIHIKKVSLINCNMCDKTFRGNSKLNVHIQSVHNKQLIPTCILCNKTFTAKSSLERHMLLHTNEKPYSCNECLISFSRSVDLRNHIRMIHEGINPYVCRECNEQFRSYHSLYMHRQIVHLKKPPPAAPFKPYQLICKLCKQIFKKSTELIEHIQQSHIEETYPYIQCPNCPKTFLSQQLLNHHKEIHTDRYRCNFCGKRNPTIQRLQIHIENKHNDVRKYDCTHCITKSYKTASALRNHVLTHTHGKQYRCDICHKNFMRKDQMIIHRRIHTGEKPFQCVVCMKRFSDDASYSKHKKRCRFLPVNNDFNAMEIEYC
ncbi:zinc finger protein ZFP2-like isoform X2 [Malaya genurostris]|uniref:zinc finger protein ZFP2-like isoform X2 n=1 Tax=Malaya genurostris TaxID=325434 RepID=UPI0026F390BC|nr:zinc finger protein ZFP2-like isoform X2 [Malaya genurostris]